MVATLPLELRAQQCQGHFTWSVPDNENRKVIGAGIPTMMSTYLSVDESQTSISSWCRRWAGGMAGGTGEISSLAAAARDTAIIRRRKERGVTGMGGTACNTKILKLGSRSYNSYLVWHLLRQISEVRHKTLIPLKILSLPSAL